MLLPSRLSSRLGLSNHIPQIVSPACVLTPELARGRAGQGRRGCGGLAEAGHGWPLERPHQKTGCFLVRQQDHRTPGGPALFLDGESETQRRMHRITASIWPSFGLFGPAVGCYNFGARQRRFLSPSLDPGAARVQFHDRQPTSRLPHDRGAGCGGNAGGARLPATGSQCSPGGGNRRFRGGIGEPASGLAFDDGAGIFRGPGVGANGQRPDPEVVRGAWRAVLVVGPVGLATAAVAGRADCNHGCVVSNSWIEIIGV